MENFKPRLRFTKQERSGVFYLLLLIVALQLSFWAIKYYPSHNTQQFELDKANQTKLDSLVLVSSKKPRQKLKPFNPNYITDYKAYVLGMSAEELGRLHEYRSQNNYINNAAHFQKITGVSDSLLNHLKPLFKFPEWKNNIDKTNKQQQNRTIVKVALKDINRATAEDLKRINGVGEKLSTRIVKFRDRLGGFLVIEQLYDVYGLEQQVVERAMLQFEVTNPPTIQKININTASVEQLASLIYIKYELASKIVRYREAHEGFKTLDELMQVEGFPKNKIDRIKLYLSF